MKNYELKLQKRSQLGKGPTKQLRKQDLVPCEIYGTIENSHCFGKYLDFEKGIFTPHVYLFELDVDGQKCSAIIKEVQFHPVTDRIMHVDFLIVDQTTPIKVKLPVELTGTSPGVMRGGKLRQVTKKLHVKGNINSLPSTIKVDISSLDVAQGIKVGNLAMDGIEFLDPKHTLVVSVDASRTTAKTEGQ